MSDPTNKPLLSGEAEEARRAHGDRGKLLSIAVQSLSGRPWLIGVLLGLGLVIGYWSLSGIHRKESPTHAGQGVEYYCPMHPQVVRAEPGNCPICGMTLVQRKQTKSAEQKAAVPDHAAVMIPGVLQQRIGVRVGRVEKGPLVMSVRAVGIVEPDETRIARLHIKTEGWVDKLFVNYVGQHVKQGDPLLAIYSPKFYAAQVELLTGLQSDRELGGESQLLTEGARRRLELWDVPKDEIDELVRTRHPREDLILRSPITGTVLARNVFQAQYVTPDRELYVIADLSMVWVQAKVYEYEIPHVELGRPATVTIPSLPDRTFTGKVVFIQPTVDEVTRTVQVRVELPNQEGIFKPGMFAQVEIVHPMGEGLLVPASAILQTGERDIAYRVEPGDHFVPVEVKISPILFGQRFQVLQGLREGEEVVTSGNFLIDSESRIRAGGGGMAGMPGMDHAGHGGKQPPAEDHTGHAGDEKAATDHSGHEGMDMPGMDHFKMKH